VESVKWLLYNQVQVKVFLGNSQKHQIRKPWECDILSIFMRRSIWKFNIPPPPGQPPGHLNFWRLACSNSLPSGQKSHSNTPPISTKLPLLKDKFRLQSNTLHAFQREICRNDTFKLLWKIYSLTKVKFYLRLVNPSNPSKSETNNHGRIPQNRR